MHRRRRGRVVLVVLAVLVGVLAIAVAALGPDYEGFFVPSAANEPTLNVGDHVLMHKGHSGLHRGDLIVFTAPAVDRIVIMRVVGVAGDHLSDRDGKLFVNGAPVTENYLAKGTVTSNLSDNAVPPGMVFVMGDNRGDSLDSRSYGPVPLSAVKGKLVFRYWPIGRLGGF